jgi:hypothetical protein
MKWGVVARHPYDEGVWLGDICALRSLPEGVDVLEIVGSINAEVRQQAYELGGTLAATLIG